MRLLQRSRLQLPLRMFINSPPTMESFLVNGWLCPKELMVNSDTDRMMQMITGYWVTQIVHAAATFSFRGASCKWWRDSRGDREGRRNRPLGDFPAAEKLRIARYGHL